MVILNIRCILICLLLTSGQQINSYTYCPDLYGQDSNERTNKCPRVLQDLVPLGAAAQKPKVPIPTENISASIKTIRLKLETTFVYDNCNGI